MTPPTKKIIASFVALVYSVTQVAFGAAPERNFWESRRRQLSPTSAAGSQSALASLPDLFPGAARSAWGPGSAIGTPLAPERAAGGPASERLERLTASILPSHGRLQDVYDSGDSRRPAVVLIQDIHLNA